MPEKIITVESVNPIYVYGRNEINVELIKQQYPECKIVCRGNEIKIIGNDDEVNKITEIIVKLVNITKKIGYCEEHVVKSLLKDEKDEDYAKLIDCDNDILLHGKNGLVVKAKTVNQKRLIESINKNDLIFAIGPAGTGKTYTAVALAVRALKNKEIKRIILTRPAVEAGEKLGFLPGDVKEKLDPYLQPLYDALDDMLPENKLHKYIEDGIIQIAPLAYMRGRTLSNSVAILDEAQNATLNQLKMFLTRMGRNSKFIVTGDITQIDLPKNVTSGLLLIENILSNIEGVDFIYFDERDVVRHPLVTKIIKAFSINEEKEKSDKKS